jgi:hypothetical protein
MWFSPSSTSSFDEAPPTAHQHPPNTKPILSHEMADNPIFVFNATPCSATKSQSLGDNRSNPIPNKQRINQSQN